MYLVDLPGYGYVAGLGSKRGTEHFVSVAETYLKERAGKELVDNNYLLFVHFCENSFIIASSL